MLLVLKMCNKNGHMITVRIDFMTHLVL